ncbi:MAG: DoxX family membrane protein [Acidobacteriota bacterium]
MKFAVLGARILLGLVFFVFGLNGFFGFLPPPELTPAAQEFFGALVGSGFLFEFIKATEVVCGALLLAGVLVPLALTVLAPIVLNIVAFHLFLDPAGMPIALVILALQVFLAWAYRGHFASVLRAKAQPTLG